MYDADGRLLYSEPEAEFDQYDREHFEALFDLRADTCRCGGLISETTRGDGHGYDITHTTCWRCHALTVAQEKHEAEATDGKHRDARGNKIAPSTQMWSATYLPPKNP